jgi:hypothetical protein
MINYKLKITWEDSVVACFKVLSRNVSARLCKTATDDISVSISCLRAERKLHRAIDCRPKHNLLRYCTFFTTVVVITLLYVLHDSCVVITILYVLHVSCVVTILYVLHVSCVVIIRFLFSITFHMQRFVFMKLTFCTQLLSISWQTVNERVTMSATAWLLMLGYLQTDGVAST